MHTMCTPEKERLAEPGKTLVNKEAPVAQLWIEQWIPKA